MSSRKRSRASAGGSEPDLLIKTADGQPIPAKSVLVRTFSTCAEELPAGAGEWDVSGFLFEGEPFSQQTVKCWLACGHSMLYGAGELDAEDQAQLRTAKGLHSVLAFAHAVGSPEGLCKAACSSLEALVIQVQLPEHTLPVPVCNPEADGALVLGDCDGGDYLCRRTLTGWVQIGHAVLPQQEQDVKQQVAAQTAALLHIAHVLHLQPLVDVLHSFIRWSTMALYSLLDGVLDSVFTEAVLEAALGSSTISKETYMRSVLAQPCSLTGSVLCPQGLVKPVGKFAVNRENGCVSVEAQLLQDFQGAKAGDRVLVSVDVFKSSGHALGIFKPDGQEICWFPACLLVGNSMNSDGDLVC